MPPQLISLQKQSNSITKLWFPPHFGANIFSILISTWKICRSYNGRRYDTLNAFGGYRWIPSASYRGIKVQTDWHTARLTYSQNGKLYERLVIHIYIYIYIYIYISENCQKHVELYIVDNIKDAKYLVREWYIFTWHIYFLSCRCVHVITITWGQLSTMVMAS